LARHSITLRQPCCSAARRNVPLLISVKLLECIARLFSGNLCACCIASKALRQGKLRLIFALLELIIKMELSNSDLQQSNGFTIISFKSQLSDLGPKGRDRSSLFVYIG